MSNPTKAQGTGFSKECIAGHHEGTPADNAYQRQGLDIDGGQFLFKLDVLLHLYSSQLCDSKEPYTYKSDKKGTGLALHGISAAC